MTTEKEICRTDLYEKYNSTVHGDVLCNCCGESLFKSSSFSFDNNIYNDVDMEISYVTYGAAEHYVDGGYASPHLTDGTRYFYSMCEECLHNLFFNVFKTPPKEYDYFQGGTYDEKLKVLSNIIPKLKGEICSNILAFEFVEIRDDIDLLEKKFNELNNLVQDLKNKRLVKKALQ